jgi:hypothetical protein
MKRELNLIRLLLQIIEKSANGEPIQITEKNLKQFNECYTQDLIDEHILLLVEKKLVRVATSQLGRRLIMGLTWEGQDFLANANVNQIWEKAKKAAGNLSFGIFTNLLNKAAENLAISVYENLEKAINVNDNY